MKILFLLPMLLCVQSTIFARESITVFYDDAWPKPWLWTGTHMVGAGYGYFVSSPDGLNWEAHTVPELDLTPYEINLEWDGVNNRFIAFIDGIVLTSSDGLDWSPLTSTNLQRIYHDKHGNWFGRLGFYLYCSQNLVDWSFCNGSSDPIEVNNVGPYIFFRETYDLFGQTWTTGSYWHRDKGWRTAFRDLWMLNYRIASVNDDILIQAIENSLPASMYLNDEEPYEFPYFGLRSTTKFYLAGEDRHVSFDGREWSTGFEFPDFQTIMPGYVFDRDIENETITRHEDGLVVIFNEPNDQQVDLGHPFQLEIDARATDQISYQWYKDSEIIAGATSSIYSVAQAGVEDAGTYSCLVSIDAQSVMSESILVTVNCALRVDPVMSEIPFCYGDNLVLAVDAIGDSPFTYAWFRASKPMGDQPFLALTGGVETVGSYYCDVTDRHGCVVRSQPIQVYPTPDGAPGTMFFPVYELQGDEPVSFSLQSYCFQQPNTALVTPFGTFEDMGAVTLPFLEESTPLTARFYDQGVLQEEIRGGVFLDCWQGAHDFVPAWGQGGMMPWAAGTTDLRDYVAFMNQYCSSSSM